LYDFGRTVAFFARYPMKEFGNRVIMPPEPLYPASVAASIAGTDAFSIWLRRGLHHLHSAIVAEPIPPELLRLIGEPSKQPAPGAEEPPSPREWEADISDTERGFEQRVHERAYFLWLEEGCPEGRALVHWALAFTQQVAQEARERHMDSPARPKRKGAAASFGARWPAQQGQ
jgi:Protein of unknown function (DUF2934)